MINAVLTKIFGTAHAREMKRLGPVIDKINSLESRIKAMSDAELQNQTVQFKERIAKGESLDTILPEAFAVCREAGKRVLNMRHYDVQLIGGMILHRGSIAEMRTGEGKTLVATLPAYLNGLSGKGVHIVTVNDYLARRDAEWMGRLYGWLGLTTDVIVHGQNDVQKKAAYMADISYCTNNELGFDYLRDNMKFDLADYAQRPLNFAIVDECDSILIDEARTPLIISGPAEDSTDKYYVVNAIIPHLKREQHFTMEEKSKTVALTEEGNQRVEELLKIENLYDPQNIELLHHVYQGLKAHHLYSRDVDYMVKDGEIIIVDEFTGRLMEGRRWSDGLHQAVEAKEGVTVKNENQTLATITFQNYFRMYKKLAGMTGTAETEAVEMKKIYGLDVSVIPTNKPIRRMDHEDVVFKNANGKYISIVRDIVERQKNGQPTLVGTVSIERSELISKYLREHSIPHKVLNAKHHEQEAEIVAQAGRKGAVTIATNMAGRGTDIVLGGNPEFLARQVNSDETSEEYQAALTKFKAQCEKEKEDVVTAGGLYIIGTERHESRRIDNQLRGRSGRQGDPGESRFFLGLDDDLMRKFNGERVSKIMDAMKIPDDEPITARMVSRSIEGAQRKVEGHNFDIRKHLIDYDDVMNKQRTAIYSLRREVLQGDKLDEIVREMLGDQVSGMLDTYVDERGGKDRWNLEGLRVALLQQFGLEVGLDGLSGAAEIVEKVKSSIVAGLEFQKTHLGPFFQQVSKMILLQTIDQRWKEHLQRMDQMREWIGLRGYAQKDPLVEYKQEAFKMFEEMNTSIRAETLEKLFKIQLVMNQQDQGDIGAPPEYAQELNGGSFEPRGEISKEARAEAESQLEALKPKKTRLTFGPPTDDDDGPGGGGGGGVSRAERRRLEREKRRR
ncbi:MAG: preprotein translocase subunit SecA [Bdellovibrionales bacterium]|jgi:preprotein translocase subunit SecA|nr:preprotein translocase subunit SecA [Bdellovibrionales bacterium]